MKIGVAKEIKPDEHRVALTPAGARELTQKGHEVVVEQGAGEGSALTDAAYEAVGARIASVDDVWSGSDLVLKVKEPLASEFGRLREGLILFTYLHLAADEALTRALLDSGAICIAYETVETDDRQLPLLAPMSEVAGRLATQMGAWALEKSQGGRGILLGGLPGVPPAKVVVLGGGIVGYNAALIAVGMQADVWVLDKSVQRMRDPAGRIQQDKARAINRKAHDVPEPPRRQLEQHNRSGERRERAEQVRQPAKGFANVSANSGKSRAIMRSVGGHHFASFVIARGMTNRICSSRSVGPSFVKNARPTLVSYRASLDGMTIKKVSFGISTRRFKS